MLPANSANDREYKKEESLARRHRDHTGRRGGGRNRRDGASQGRLDSLFQSSLSSLRDLRASVRSTFFYSRRSAQFAGHRVKFSKSTCFQNNPKSKFKNPKSNAPSSAENFRSSVDFVWFCPFFSGHSGASFRSPGNEQGLKTSIV